MTLEEARDKLATALRDAALIHSMPVSFSLKELASFYGGPPPALAGRIGARYLANLRSAFWLACDCPAIDLEYDGRFRRFRLAAAQEGNHAKA